jgi:hypothetical protein
MSFSLGPQCVVIAAQKPHLVEQTRINSQTRSASRSSVNAYQRAPDGRRADITHAFDYDRNYCLKLRSLV